MKSLLTLATALVCLSLGSAASAERVPPGSDDDIRERLRPFGEVCVVGSECAAGTVASGTAVAAVGVAVNTSQMAEGTAGDLLRRIEDDLGLPAVDPFKDGVAPIVARLS